MCLGLLLTGSVGRAQDARSISGSVHTIDGTPLAEAVVAPLGGPAAGSVTTASAGRFKLRVPAGTSQLVAAHIGFAPETLAVSAEMLFRLRPAPVTLDPLVVSADPAFSAASSRVIRSLDIELRPRESSQELLRLTPGLVIAQHAGGGKAEQIFLRGFDADHGTDVAISVDGAPVNMVSHAHGQGYADLHFLIPEVVERVDVRKGPYDAADGDFATAGAMSFRTKDRISGAEVETRGGSFGTVHGVSLIPFGGDAAHAGGYVALSAAYSRGPFLASQDHRRVNGFARWTAPVGSGVTLAATASGFDARWNASGQIPERAVARGLVDRFGSLDPTEGGATYRYDASVALRSGTGGGGWELRAYGARYRLDLFSNFTFFLSDSVHGDGIEQLDNRTVTGLQGQYSRAARMFGLNGRTEVGFDARADFADVALYHQEARVRLDTRVRGTIAEQRYSGWVKQDLRLTPRIRLDMGIRGDVFRFGFTNRLSLGAMSSPPGDGVRWLARVSPKANLAVDLGPGTTLFGNLGLGFHSNDARDVVSARPVDNLLPRAVGAELGARHTWSGGSLAASAWGLDLESELVYVGDEGTTEASGRTRRMGVELEGRTRVKRWLWVDGDVALSRGRFRDAPAGENRISLAPTVTANGGLTLRDLGSASGGLRIRYLGARAADEANTIRARGYTLLEVFGAYELGSVRLFGAVDNLLNASWNEAQFATTSRLLSESSPVTDLDFTPGSGRALQVGVGYRF